MSELLSIVSFMTLCMHILLKGILSIITHILFIIIELKLTKAEAMQAESEKEGLKKSSPGADADESAMNIRQGYIPTATGGEYDSEERRQAVMNALEGGLSAAVVAGAAVATQSGTPPIGTLTAGIGAATGAAAYEACKTKENKPEDGESS